MGMGWIVSLVYLVASTQAAFAQSSAVTAPAPADYTSSPAVEPGAPSTHSKIEDVLRDKKFKEDKRITDLELRSYAGSLSRYSAQFNLGYNGSPVNDLADSNRPNPDGRAGDNRTLLSGSMALRYRTTSDTAINLGTGMKFYTPYQAVTGQEVDRRPNTKTYDIADPQVSFDMTGAAGPTQLRTQIRAIYTTEDYYKNEGEIGYAGVAQYVKWRPAVLSRVIIGAQVSADYSFYDRPYQGYVSKQNPGDGNIGRYTINFIPSFEYKLTDNLNFNTSLGYGFLNYRKDSNWANWTHQLATWRVGLGWAITHTVYFNPYVNFFAESPAFNTASLNFNTTFSIF